MRTRIFIGMLIGGAVLGYFGYRELRLALAARGEPTRITCAELAAKGPGDNAHIVLTDFVGCSTWYVYEAEATRKAGPYKTVLMPAVPLGGEWHQALLKLLEEHDGEIPDGVEPPRPKSIRVMMKFKDVANEDALTALIDRDTLQGMIVNKIESLDSDDKRLLRQGYGNIDFDRLLIFEHERTPTSTSAAVACLVGAGVLVGVPVLLGLRKLRESRVPVAQPAQPQPPAPQPAPQAQDRNPYQQP
jgi:hypothetical protein